MWVSLGWTGTEGALSIRMKVATRIISTLLLAFLPVVVVEATHEELPHGEPNEELVEKHRGSKARVHH